MKKREMIIAFIDQYLEIRESFSIRDILEDLDKEDKNTRRLVEKVIAEFLKLGFLKKIKRGEYKVTKKRLQFHLFALNKAWKNINSNQWKPQFDNNLNFDRGIQIILTLASRCRKDNKYDFSLKKIAKDFKVTERYLHEILPLKYMENTRIVDRTKYYRFRR